MTIDWDTTLTPDKFPNKIKEIFYNQNILQRKKYTKWIGEISKKNNKLPEWWSTNTVTRNPYISNIYRAICIIETIKKLKKNHSFNLIVNSIELKKVIQNIFSNTKKINSIKLKKNSYKLYNFFIFFKSIFFHIIIYLTINLFVKKNKVKEKAILLNTYPSLNPLVPERLYKLKNNLKNNKVVNFYFVPTFIITRKFYELWKIIQILKKEKNYIFKEHHLSKKNFLYSILHFYRSRKFIDKFHKYNGYNLSILVNAEIKSVSNYSSRINCMLNYYFFEELRLKKIKLKKCVSWLENQPDKLWNFGLNKFYPNIKSVGYQGFTNIPQLMNSIPAEHEKKYSILPKTVISSGKAYVKARKEFYRNLNIKVGPSLVYQDLLNKKKNKKKNIKFLVILSDFEDINQSILELLIKNKELFKDILIPIKLPKNKSKKDFKIKDLPSNFLLTNENLQSLIPKSENIICPEISSTIFESLISNCYLIIPNINYSNEYFLKQIGIPKNRFTTISNNSEFIQTIKLLKKKKNNLFYPTGLVNSLFKKVNKKNITLLF